MATSDRKNETNLSEELLSKEKENGSISCDEKDFVLENKNSAKSGLNDNNLDESVDPTNSARKDDQEFVDQNIQHSSNRDEKMDCNVNSNANNYLGNEQQCCINEPVEGAKIDGNHKKKQSLPKVGGGMKVDEVLIEEDEINCSEGEEEHYESAEEEHLTPEEAEERVKEALDLKKEGNDHFRKQEYDEGKDFYTKAIKCCPKEFKQDKSIFYANRAACYQKLEDYENAISDCSQALELAPDYLKARLRRAQCYEKVEKLEEALEDYKLVFESDKSCQPAREAIMRLPEEIKIKHEKLKDEMIGKLKDLGNMVLRPFGLSTDNFKLQQDPNSGGYSINFQK